MTFDVVEEAGGTLRVTLAGELDITNVDTLASADSSAIALWVRWASAVPQIELRDVSPLLRRVVESMGLAETLHVTP
jgi:hypothetical protein